MKHILLLCLLITGLCAQGQENVLSPNEFLRNDSVFRVTCITYATWPSHTECDTFFVRLMVMVNHIEFGAGALGLFGDSAFITNRDWFVNLPYEGRVGKDGHMCGVRFRDTTKHLNEKYNRYRPMQFDARNSIVTLYGIDSTQALKEMMYRLNELYTEAYYLREIVRMLNLEQIDKNNNNKEFHEWVARYMAYQAEAKIKSDR